MNKEEIFKEAADKCENGITRNLISRLVNEDKTNTIKKYLVSLGIMQLALHLQGIYATNHPDIGQCAIKLNEWADPNQKRPTPMPPKKGVFSAKPKNNYVFTPNKDNKIAAAVYWEGAELKMPVYQGNNGQVIYQAGAVQPVIAKAPKKPKF